LAVVGSWEHIVDRRERRSSHARTHADTHTHMCACTHADQNKLARTHTHAHRYTHDTHAHALTHADAHMTHAEGGSSPACVSMVRGETVEVGQKRQREGAWGTVRVFPHIQR